MCLTGSAGGYTYERGRRRRTEFLHSQPVGRQRGAVCNEYGYRRRVYTAAPPEHYEHSPSFFAKYPIWSERVIYGGWRLLLRPLVIKVLYRTNSRLAIICDVLFACMSYFFVAVTTARNRARVINPWAPVIYRRHLCDKWRRPRAPLFHRHHRRAYHQQKQAHERTVLALHTVMMSVISPPQKHFCSFN